MTENIKKSKNVYDIMENDKGEIMVLLYAGNEAPSNPSFSLNEQNSSLELIRNKKDIVDIAGLQSETMDKLKNIENLYICELKYNEDSAAESEITYAYKAPFKKTENDAAQPEKADTQKKTKKEELSNKIKQTRNKIENKKNPL